MGDQGPVQLPRGKIIGKQWQIVKKLGEGGCGAVYKVWNINSAKQAPEFAALKAESNFVAGGSVLKLEVQILRRLASRPHVAQLLQCGKKQNFCYVVMTLLGDPLNTLLKKCGRLSSISTQVRIGINVLFGIKQIHDIGFIHRDLKPANIAIGNQGHTTHFLHILDFGLAREYVIVDDDDKQVKMRRPRARVLFRGTTRYCSINTHDRLEQGRGDDLWSLFYMLAELRGQLPWYSIVDKTEVGELKRLMDFEGMLENSPVELVKFGQHLLTLTYYTRPDYSLLFNLLNDVMIAGKFKWSDQWDWERLKSDSKSLEIINDVSTLIIAQQPMSREKTADKSFSREYLDKSRSPLTEFNPEDPFPADFFSKNNFVF